MYVRLVQDGMYTDHRIDLTLPYERLAKFSQPKLVLEEKYKTVINSLRKKTPDFDPLHVMKKVNELLRWKLVKEIGRREFEISFKCKNINKTTGIINLLLISRQMNNSFIHSFIRYRHQQAENKIKESNFEGEGTGQVYERRVEISV